MVAYPGQGVYEFGRWGHVAEWLRNGLQNRVHQFNSGRGLHPYNQWLGPIIGDSAASRPGAQETAYQPSGNGISGQGPRLSLAARGDGWERWVWTTKSSSGAGAMALCTASSIKSYSTSLIALSGFPEAMVAKVRCFQIARIVRVLTIRQSRQRWLLKY